MELDRRLVPTKGSARMEYLCEFRCGLISPPLGYEQTVSMQSRLSPASQDWEGDGTCKHEISRWSRAAY